MEHPVLQTVIRTHCTHGVARDALSALFTPATPARHGADVTFLYFGTESVVGVVHPVAKGSHSVHASLVQSLQNVVAVGVYGEHLE